LVVNRHPYKPVRIIPSWRGGARRLKGDRVINEGPRRTYNNDYTHNDYYPCQFIQHLATVIPMNEEMIKNLSIHDGLKYGSWEYRFTPDDGCVSEMFNLVTTEKFGFAIKSHNTFAKYNL
jgi:hypothetical protein